MPKIGLKQFKNNVAVTLLTFQLYSTHLDDNSFISKFKESLQRLPYVYISILVLA